MQVIRRVAALVASLAAILGIAAVLSTAASAANPHLVPAPRNVQLSLADRSVAVSPGRISCQIVMINALVRVEQAYAYASPAARPRFQAFGVATARTTFRPHYMINVRICFTSHDTTGAWHVAQIVLVYPSGNSSILSVHIPFTLRRDSGAS